MGRPTPPCAILGLGDPGRTVHPADHPCTQPSVHIRAHPASHCQPSPCYPSSLPTPVPPEPCLSPPRATSAPFPCARGTSAIHARIQHRWGSSQSHFTHHMPAADLPILPAPPVSAGCQLPPWRSQHSSLLHMLTGDGAAPLSCAPRARCCQRYILEAAPHSPVNLVRSHRPLRHSPSLAVCTAPSATGP